MSSDAVVYILTFVSATLLTLSVYNYYAKERVTQQQVNRRLTLMESTLDRGKVLELLRRERGLFGDSEWRIAQLLQLWLVQTGLRLDRKRLFLAAAALTITLTGLTFLGLGATPIALPIGLAVSGAALVFIIRVIRGRRIAKFQQQLPDVVDIIVRGLRAGHPLVTAFSLVAKETSDPAGTEFGIAFDEITFGLDVPSAVRNLWGRVGDPDLLYLVTAISVQTQSGGNLADVLTRLSYMLRERSKLRLKVQAMTAEGRLTSGLLTVLPLILMGAISLINPKYYGDVWNEPAFRTAMYTAGVLLFVGNIILRRLVNFKY